MMNNTGRYEYHDDNDGKRGSHKYWEVVYHPHNDSFSCYWGRIGAFPQSKDHMSSTEALKKIDEKLGKGYQYVGEAISALEKDPEVRIQGTITRDGEGYEDFNPTRATAKSGHAAAKKRMQKKREERAQDPSAWFMDELEKLGS